MSTIPYVIEQTSRGERSYDTSTSIHGNGIQGQATELSANFFYSLTIF